MPKSRKLLLPLVDYQRIYQVAHGIIREVGHDVSRSCLFFSMVGAYLMSRNYRVAARPVVGCAFYKIDATEKVLAIADQVQGHERSSSGGFHCWVEADDWCIDFTSPLFPEMALQSGHRANCGRKMFQKHRGNMAETLAALTAPGDYFFEPNIELTHELLSKNLERNDVTDLLTIAARWFQKPPRVTAQTMQITDDLGNRHTLKLDAPLISGVW